LLTDEQTLAISHYEKLTTVLNGAGYTVIISIDNDCPTKKEKKYRNN